MNLEQPQIDLALYRFQKAEERLLSARKLLDTSLFGDSIGRSYYAIFTAARGLLALLKLDSSKHSGVISFFNRYLIKTGLIPKSCSAIITDAKRSRETSHYGDYVEFTKEEAEVQIHQAEKFLKMVRKVFDKVIAGEIELLGPE